MTGVEAVSNGVKAFREPTAGNARRTLTVIIALLIVMLAGIAYLVRAYGIAATDPGAPGYQSVLSMLVAAVAGKGLFYYVTIGSILLVLALSANTAFADFPRLCRVISRDGFLPRSFATRGRRLVYSQGVYVLAVLSAALLVIFGGVTDRLIPLYAVGAFLAFTLSQAGMVFHWKRIRGRGWIAQHAGERPRRRCHRHHRAGSAGGQVHGWRLDCPVIDPHLAYRDGRGTPPISSCGDADRQPDAARPVAPSVRRWW